MTAHAQAVSRPETKRSSWKALEHHYRKIKDLTLRELFANDPSRGDRFTAEGGGIYLDYSKNLITDQTIRLLFQVADASGLHSRVDAMFRGEKVNITENQAALHVALRAPRGAAVFVDGENVVPKVHTVLDRMARFCISVACGEWKGATGKRIRNVINIGTGGAYFGPLLAFEALKAYRNRALTFRFVSNGDISDLKDALCDLDPAETLFIICSSRFAADKITAMVALAREWFLSQPDHSEDSIRNHFVAVAKAGQELGAIRIDKTNIFETWDWVGDRFSIDSAVGLSTMLAIGPDNFRAMLNGLHDMDMHFLATPFERNLPVLTGLLAVWYVNLFRVQALAIIPYDGSLTYLPAYLQYLAMGSNGKSITLIGTEVTLSTGPLYCGPTGTSSFPSFYQWALQGTRLVPCDLIAVGRSTGGAADHHDMLVANAFAQAKALALGNTPEDLKAEGTPDWLVPHRLVRGNRPSNTIMLDELTPDSLGRLIALYQHSIFTQAVVWNMNPFDTWGARFEEAVAKQILPELANPENPHLEHDSSTNNLIRRYRRLKFSA